MTATPPPAPPDPAGPPTSGTLESSTPTPQQLAGTKMKRGSHTCSLLRKNSLARRSESRRSDFVSSRFSQKRHHGPTESARIYKGIGMFLAQKHMKCQVRSAPNPDTLYVYVYMLYTALRGYKYCPSPCL